MTINPSCIGKKPEVVRVDIEPEEFVWIDLEEAIGDVSKRRFLAFNANPAHIDANRRIDALVRDLCVYGLVAAVGHMGRVGSGHIFRNLYKVANVAEYLFQLLFNLLSRSFYLLPRHYIIPRPKALSRNIKYLFKKGEIPLFVCYWGLC